MSTKKAYMISSLEANSNASALARRVASHGLGRFDRVRTTIDEATWAAFVPMVDVHRLSGLLAQCIRDGALDLDDAQRAEAVMLHRVAMIKVLALDRLLVESVAALAAEGIDSRLLKGCASASLLYAEPALRPYADVDLLVRGSQFAAAVASLEGCGLTRPVAELSSGFDLRFGKGATMRTHDGHGVDLHRTFLAGPLAFLFDPESLFDQAVPVTVAGTEVAALGREEGLLHACFHSTLSDNEPRLISMRDVADGCRHPSTDLDRVLLLATEWRVRMVLASALEQAWRILEPAHTNWLVDWAMDYRPSTREKWLMHAYTGDRRRWARQAAAAVPYVPSARAKVSYLLALSTIAGKRLHRRR